MLLRFPLRGNLNNIPPLKPVELVSQQEAEPPESAFQAEPETRRISRLLAEAQNSSVWAADLV